MTFENLLEAIEDCNNGLIGFNNGEARAFLYDKNWYPLYAVMNKGFEIALEPAEVSDRSTVKLTYLLPYTRIKERVLFNANLPVPLNNTEVLEEYRLLTNRMQELT